MDFFSAIRKLFLVVKMIMIAANDSLSWFDYPPNLRDLGEFLVFTLLNYILPLRKLFRLLIIVNFLSDKTLNYCRWFYIKMHRIALICTSVYPKLLFMQRCAIFFIAKILYYMKVSLIWEVLGNLWNCRRRRSWEIINIIALSLLKFCLTDTFRITGLHLIT